MVKLQTIQEVSQWLGRQPRDFVVVVAGRVALRVAPIVVQALPYERGETARVENPVILSWFHEMATVWGAAAGLLDDRYRHARHHSVEVNRGNTAFRAIVQACEAFFDPDFSDLASESIGSAARAAVDATPQVYSRLSTAPLFDAVSHDVTCLEQGVPPFALALRKLWPAEYPGWAQRSWHELRLVLERFPKAQNWWVWTDWYAARLAGGAINDELETQRLHLPARLWKGGPTAANSEIAQLIEVNAKDTRSSTSDIFVSYSTADDAYAKWITSLLVSAGFSVFARFKDIRPGSNFVREMQLALDGAQRLIALISPDYEKSDHCQSEWAAYYNKDPGGAKRLLIPLLIRPTKLNALAKQIVYCQLIGLSSTDFAMRILDAVGYAGNLPQIPSNFPGSAAFDEVNRRSGGVFRVGPGEDGLLERESARASRSKEAGFSSEQLYSAMAKEIGGFLGHIEKSGGGNFSCSSRLKDRAAKLEACTSVDISKCDPLEIQKNLT
jgi:hypothetical protein